MGRSNRRRHAFCGKDDVKSIGAEIMMYLQQRPMASDTLDGIAHWWLVQQEIEKNIDQVKQALEQLTDEGKISAKMNANSNVIYSLNPTHKSTKR